MPLIGHFPPAARYFSISLLSNKWPVFVDITGSWGTSPETDKLKKNDKIRKKYGRKKKFNVEKRWNWWKAT